MTARVAALGALAATPLGCAWIAGVSGDAALISPGPDGGVDGGSNDEVVVVVIATDATYPDTGLPPDPGAVTCGAQKCPLTAEAGACCAQGGAPFCQNATDTCNGATARCDEAADCPAGQVCCVTAIIPAGLQTACRTACGKSDRRACRSHRECPSACVPWRCAGGTVGTCDGEGADAGCVP